MESVLKPAVKKILSMALVFALFAGIISAVPLDTKAAGFSVSSGLSGDMSCQVFHISNPGGEALYYDVQKENGMIEVGVPVASDKTLTFNDINAFYVVYLYNDAGEEVSAVSPASHSYTVSYDIGGKLVTAETGEIPQGDSFTFQADEYYIDGSREYRIRGGESASQMVYFGRSQYVFHYDVYEPDPVTAKVNYVDTSGNILGGDSKSVSYYGGNVVFDIPASVDFDNREYVKVSQTNAVTVNYYSPQLEYDIMYQMKDAPQAGPYSVELLFQAEDGTLLGNRYYTVDPEDDVVEFPVQPQTLSARNGGTVTYYEAVDHTVITHDTKSDIRQYVIVYREYDRKSPYQWSIRLLNAANGKLLKTDQKEVKAEGSASYDAESIIEADGDKYILDAGMKKQYTHQYGDDRVLNVYYNKEGRDVAASYHVNVRYRSVSKDTLIYETTLEVTPDEPVVIKAPEEYESENTSFVKLKGQDEEITHKFYDAQRSYTVYYRDVNDLQNVDTVVTQEEFITLENVINQVEEVLVDVPETEAVADEAVPAEGAEATPETVVVLNNPTTGELVTLTDEGVPLANIPAEKKVVKDEETPLANIGDKAQGVPGLFGNPAALTAIGAAVLAALFGLFVFIKKKNQHSQVEVTASSEEPKDE